MPKITSFPDDDEHWFVRWIDGLHASGNAAPNIGVTLAKLPRRISSAGEFKQAWLTAELEQKRCPIGAGDLPLVRIGTVYRRQEFEFDPATRGVKIDYSNSDWRHTQINKAIDPQPPTWRSTSSVLELNLSEYRVGGRFESWCWMAYHEGTTYVVPDVVVFQTFYGRSSGTARELLSQPWAEAQKRLISFDRYLSGIETASRPDQAVWNIVLETGVDLSLAPFLALLMFDEVACARANAIHSTRVARGMLRSGPDPIQAQIPFSDDALAIGVAGLALNPIYGLPRRGPRFLVTAITHLTWPDRIPRIDAISANSADRGLTQIEADTTAPFVRSGRSIQGRDASELVSVREDPGAGTTKEEFLVEPMTWLVGPQIGHQQKTISQRYSECVHVPPRDRNVRETSTGEPRAGDEAPNQATIDTPTLPVEPRFTAILDAFNSIAALRRDFTFNVIRPSQSSLSVTVGDNRCWAMAAHSLRQDGTLPRRHWTVIHISARHVVSRAALAIEIRIAHRRFIWIEIQQRETEEGFKALVIEPVHQACEGLVECAAAYLASVEGRVKLEQAAASLVLPSSTLKTYTHWSHIPRVAQGQKASLRRELDSSKLLKFLVD